MVARTNSAASSQPRLVRMLQRFGLIMLIFGGMLLILLPPTTRAATNLALGKPALASSAESPATGASLAVDGDPATRWSSAFADPQWLQVDLGSVQSFNQVILRWEAAFGRAYQIQVSNDAKTWAVIADVTNSNGGIDDLVISGTGRYVRLYGTQRATQYGYSVWELEIYDESTSPTPTATLLPGVPTPTPVPTPTIAPSGSCPRVTNIALNKPAYTWYYDTKEGPAPKAVDGDMSSRWSHLWYPSGPAQAWLYVDLGSEIAHVNHIKIFWEDAFAADYQIQTSNDAVNWTTAKSVVNNTSLINEHAFPAELTARYVRINMTRKATAFGYSIFELELYGCGVRHAIYTPAPTPLAGTLTRVWVDDFDGTTLNTANWAYDNDVHVNGEQQQYTSSNLAVSNGTLKITARRETVNGYPFTSGRIISKDLKTFTYGKMVARMRLPVGEGFWPAFWMMGNNIDTVGWPGNGELDIMENIGYANWTSGALHGPGYWGAGSAGGLVNLPSGQTVADWHTYAVEWDPTFIKWFVDDRMIQSFTREQIIANYGQWTFDNPKFFLLNMALGGEYPAGYNGCTGSPLPTGCAYFGVKQSTVDTILAGGGVTEIDYVEVWQRR